MDITAKKQRLMWSVVNFLQDELTNENVLSDERKESVEVAIQCLESAFDIDSEVRKKYENEKVDLLSLFPANVEVSEENKKLAEECKTRGNNYMKSSEYKEAVAEYTKAIKLNPNNAVYYCNRAAAYSRLEKHLDAIDDCREAIKLDKTYGKAYGRLGIAYCNLNKFEEARKALRTALQYDPNNPTYETNLKLAEEKMFGTMGTGNIGPQDRVNVMSELMNNPNIVDLCSQMLSNPQMRNLMVGVISNESEAIQGLIQGRCNPESVQNLLQA
ncbi:unnamed protein product [Acanthoscelides obtectus]|uniref:SGTA homodimerisation domain-containing protein n=1 Tax=Acanthoscelides obtectus TaxID=200917 RepID=A0A9P0JZN5_ACAOB|nr:unnamed protein product [Acanthoscelides obtectus]CAK1628838.1 Small glutamine-rich tetratricopeptide repeat-containing protein alpha [Acanthoscelides obtectus]